MLRKTLSYLYRKSPVIFNQAIMYHGKRWKAVRFAYRHFRVRNHTHASIIDLLHLEKFIEVLHHEGLIGTIVECGSWRGGSAALMQRTAASLGWQNEMFVYDSFEGFPLPDEPEVDGKKSQGIKEGKYDWIKASQQDVVNAFCKLNVYSPRVHIIKGWFNETTPQSSASRISLLHCDGDLYESTMTTLESFYHKVVSGGFIVSNDYGEVWIGAKKAIDEWIAEYCPHVTLHRIVGGGAYFRKL